MAGVVTQGVHPGHPAIDIACSVGTPVRAAHDGQARVEQSYTHGITVVLQGSGNLSTSYSHLSSALPAGSVRRGDVIGACGSTGVWSTGPHLHFESNQPELLSSLATENPTAPAGNRLLGAIGGSIEALASGGLAPADPARRPAAAPPGTAARSMGLAAGSPPVAGPAGSHQH